MSSSAAALATAPCWIVTDGAAGNERQARALAQAMRLETAAVRANLRGPWRWFAPKFTAGLRLGLRRDLATALAPPWPALAIGCGRQAALITRILRELSGGKTFTVQILDPRIEPTDFDLVIAPRHDALSGSNVIQTLGALNTVDDDWLAQGLVQFSNLEQLPRPRTALLIGGPRKGLGMDDAWFDALLARVAALVHSASGSLMVTCSRRTPERWRRRLHGLLQDGCSHIWTGPDDGENPYQGYLAAADCLVVTPDSVNMLSEACATGRPVLTMLPATAQGKLLALHTELRDQGWLHALDGDVVVSTLTPPAPLRELAAVASKVWHVLESTRPETAVALSSS